MAKAKKVKLPFVVEPRQQSIVELVGTDESGKIEILRRGFLTVAEKSFIQQAMGGDSPILGLHRLAGKVASANGMEPAEVLEIFGRGEISNSIFDSVASELIDVIEAMKAFEARRKLAAATGLLMYRHDQSWGIEDTLNLHPDLVEGLFELYVKEEIGSLEGFEQDPSVGEEQETEGK